MAIKFTTRQNQAIQRGMGKRKRLVELAGKAANATLNQKFPHTYLFGPAGVGKSFEVQRSLDNSGIPYQTVTGSQSMFAFGVDLAVINYSYPPGQPVVISVDDCDELLKNEQNINILKNVLVGSKVYAYSKSMQAQKSSLTETQLLAVEHHSDDSSMGFKVPTDRFIFIFTSNAKLPTDDEVEQARERGLKSAALLAHRNAIRSRCKTSDFDLEWEDQWGWIADVVLNEHCIDHLVPDLQMRIELLDWMYHNWSNMTEHSIRTAEKMAEIIVDDPTGYRDTWEIDFLR